ncbi:Chloroplastic import inner membrane translocase subunit HP30-2-like protein [Drosera capensis]
MVSNSIVAAAGDSNSHQQQQETTTTMGGNIIQLFEPKAAGGGGGGFNFLPPSENPIVAVQAKFKELETGFKTWLSKQSIAVEAAVVTATSAVQGAAIGAFMGTITGDVSTTLPPPDPSLGPQALASFQQAQALAGGPLIQARNFAVMTGVNAGISSVMKRLRGKDDVQTSMVAAFGSGAMFSLVSGMGSPNQLQNVITSGIFFALVQGGIFTVAQKFSVPPTEDLFYTRTRSMLSSLGLQNYEKNFKRGLALRDVKIPPGPRLLILDHIQRDTELQESRGKL